MQRNIFTFLVTVGWLFCAAHSPAQLTRDRAVFEVASIKPAPGCDALPGRVPRYLNDRIILPCVTLRNLIRVASNPNGIRGLTRIDVLGGPSWIDKDTFNLEAKAESATSIAEMTGPMLLLLLEERFQLKVHKEFRNKPIYEMTVVKSNPNMKPSKEGSCIPRDDNATKAISADPTEFVKNRYCGPGPISRNGSRWIIDWYGVSMPEFASQILSAARLDRPVIDKTGLTGRFDFHLEFIRETGSSGLMTLNGVPVPDFPASSADAADGPSIFVALKEQLGLKLAPANGQVEVIVIDRVEKLIAN
jgi:uncharacterized protein (TIGR03435 family)